MSVDYPFSEWHELPICYVGRGATVLSRRVFEDQAAGGAGRPSIVEANLSNPPGRNGYLLFCSFDLRDYPLDPPGMTVANNLRERFVRGLTPWNLASVGGGPILPSYQVQLYVESEYPLTRAEQEQALAFFRHVCPMIRRIGPGVEKGKS